MFDNDEIRIILAKTLKPLPMHLKRISIQSFDDHKTINLKLVPYASPKAKDYKPEAVKAQVYGEPTADNIVDHVLNALDLYLEGRVNAQRKILSDAFLLDTTREDLTKLMQSNKNDDDFHQGETFELASAKDVGQDLLNEVVNLAFEVEHMIYDRDHGVEYKNTDADPINAVVINRFHKFIQDRWYDDPNNYAPDLGVNAISLQTVKNFLQFEQENDNIPFPDNNEENAKKMQEFLLKILKVNNHDKED